MDKSHPGVSKALQALAKEPGRLNRGTGKVGTILDTLGLGGVQIMRATVFAYAGVEDVAFVKDQIDVGLSGFDAVLSVNAIDELVQTYKGRCVYLAGVRWPSIYHVRLLALTHAWRTPENRRKIAKCIERLVKLSPLPKANVRYKGRLIAPASFCMDDFDPVMANLDDAHWMMWFHRMEMLSRMGVVRSVRELERQVNQLEAMLEAHDGWFTKPLTHPYFRNRGSYTGVMLERDWKKPWRRQADLTFRSLLILHYYRKHAA